MSEETPAVKRRRGRPSLPSSKLNRFKNRKVWRLEHTSIHLHNTVFETWRSVKASGTFSSDSSFAAWLLSLEMKRREKIGAFAIKYEAGKTAKSGRKRSQASASVEKYASSTPMKMKPDSARHTASQDSSGSSRSEVDDSPSKIDITGVSLHSVLGDTVIVARPHYSESESDDNDSDDAAFDAEREADELSFHLQDALRELKGAESNSTDTEEKKPTSDSDEDDVQELDDSIVQPEPESPELEIAAESPPAPVSELQHEESIDREEHTAAPRFTRLEDKHEFQDELKIVNSTKVICTVDILESLFQRSTCEHEGCGLPISIEKKKVQGCTLIIYYKCMKEHKGKWASSWEYKGVYTNNMQVAAATLLTGNNFAKLKMFAKCLSLHFISESTYYRIQRLYTIPVIDEWWSWMRDQLLDELEGDGVVLCGDGQCDSPGRCAKYLCYYLMESINNYIVHIEVMDKRETGGKSSMMEKAALKKALEHLQNILNIQELVTDASSTVKKMMADEFKKVFHSLDIWHKAKSIRKGISKVSKAKSMVKIHLWSSAIIKHFWHCSEVCFKDAKTDEEAESVLKSKWLSILHHVCNEHDWSGGQCDHDDISEEEHDLPWFDHRDKDFEALQKIICEPALLGSFKFYVRFRHTGELESVNALSLMYAPKRCAFQNKAFAARKTLAAIDHNYHLNREGTYTSRRFNPRTKVWDIRNVKVAKDYSYLPMMQARVFRERATSNKNMGYRVLLEPNDPRRIAPTIASVQPPQEIQRRSRFKK